MSRYFTQIWFVAPGCSFCAVTGSEPGNNVTRASQQPDSTLYIETAQSESYPIYARADCLSNHNNIITPIDLSIFWTVKKLIYRTELLEKYPSFSCHILKDVDFDQSNWIIMN